MISVTIFGGGSCAKAHINSFSKLSCSKDLSIKVYTNNSKFFLDNSEYYFHSLSIDTPNNYKKSESSDIVLIANKSLDHLHTWRLSHNKHNKTLTIIEKPFAASLASKHSSISFLSSNSFVLFQKRMLFSDLVKNKYFKDLYEECLNKNSIQLKSRLVKHSSVLKKLKALYKGLSLKHIILLHFCIHEIDLIEYCSNSKITELNSCFSIKNLDSSMISIEGEITGHLQCGLKYSISYKHGYGKFPEIDCFDCSGITKINQYQRKNYSDMAQIRDAFWQQVIDGDRDPLRRLTSCISIENLIIK